VVAFPRTHSGQDLLVGGRRRRTEQQLRDLHIRVRASEPPKPA
jgi:aspartyl-tRNA synthetase